MSPDESKKNAGNGNGNGARRNGAANGNGHRDADDLDGDASDEVVKAAIEAGFNYAQDDLEKNPDDLTEPDGIYPDALLPAGTVSRDPRMFGADWRYSLPPDERPPDHELRRFDDRSRKTLELMVKLGLPSQARKP